MANLGRWILLILAVAFALFVLYRCVSDEQPFGIGTTTSDGVEVNLQEIIPKSWEIQSGMGPDKCNFDSDEELEQLLVYRYDRNIEEQGGLLGAVIYDSQVNSAPQEPANQSPYRPAFLVPYKLLPDFYGGKGQGYLGEGTAMVYPISEATRDQNECQADEINVAGTTYNNGNLTQPNFLSMFRWADESIGYVGVHFVGNARIDIKDGADKRITGVTTFNRLNDRSALCEAQPYTRLENTDPKAAPQFRREGSTIDFCFVTPADPFYPEGVVVALLRGSNPQEGTTPTGNSYLTDAGKNSLPQPLAFLGDPKREQAVPILAIVNQGSVALTPEQGDECSQSSSATQTPNVTQTPAVWWCAREQATVVTDIQVNGQTLRVTWTLISMANQTVIDDIHWRVDNVAIQ